MPLNKPTPYESILLSSSPITPPSSHNRPSAPSLTAQYQKRERPFSAREYVEAQKALLKARQERAAGWANHFPSHHSNSSLSKDRIPSSRREFNRQRQLKPPGVLRYDPFEEELEKDRVSQMEHRERLAMPRHLRVVSHQRNATVKEELIEEKKTRGKGASASSTGDAPEAGMERHSNGSSAVADSALGAIATSRRRQVIKPLSQIAQYEHSPSVVKSQMMMSMREHAANPRMWVRSVLGATLERGFYEIPKVELANDPFASNMLDEDHAEFLQIFEGEDEETYEDLDEEQNDARRTERASNEHLDESSTTTKHRPHHITQQKDDIATTSTGSLKIYPKLNIVTKPYASIPKLDPNVELVRIESKRDDSAYVKHTLHGEKRRKTFFDTDSERDEEDSIHTGMDSDFMQSVSNGVAGETTAATSALDALRRTSINSPTVKFDLKDSFPLQSDQHSSSGSARSSKLIDDFKYTPQHSTKTLETQFDDLNLGKDLEEVVANIWAAPDRANEIAENHKSLIENSVSLRHQQEKAREKKESMDEYEALVMQLHRINDADYFGES
eukprot:CAMPEP_0117442792 /NCGR_PEP_ID=MMETSP0759-20121206/4344_1 /TAXON_ID=63605 /ORGANISM="Percolomonas cosmopolitus, Strain WS" /LENGTH=558 /DNA_ID=CAMNT_0005234711 /DNA_START=60 /DNA_END=1736 /DNA_ORIENTATION=-